MENTYHLPKITHLCFEGNFKLRLQHSRVVVTQAGILCVVAHTYGAGYYGRFRGETFHPNMQCTEAIVAELQDVEARGLEAVMEIGMLTGRCCVCGRTLTNEESIAGGIGPICGGRFMKSFPEAYRELHKKQDTGNDTLEAL